MFRTPSLLLILILCLSIKSVWSAGTLSIRLVRYLNPGGVRDDGKYCDSKYGIKTSSCDPVFIICLDRKDSTSVVTHVCPHGRIQTGKIINRDNLIFGINIGDTANPMLFKFVEWPGSVYFKMKVYDHDRNEWDYIDTLRQLIEVRPTSSGSGGTELTITGRTVLTMSVQVFCEYGYFGDSCTKFCVAADSDLGHYVCDPNGDKICHSGWTGVNCDEPTDECGPQPCMNGGHCIDLHNGYNCQCPPGFTGDRCENNTDECAGNPCLNEGICLDGANNYTCVCDAGFEGRNCEIAVDPCLLGSRNLCENNGSCESVNTTDYVCHCQEGYFGDNCEFEITSTSSSNVVPSGNPSGGKNNYNSGGEAIFGTSIRLKVSKTVTRDEADTLEPWIVKKLSEVENMNASSVSVRVKMTQCAGEQGEAITELILYIQYSMEGMSKDEVDLIVSYLSTFVERGFPYSLYPGRVSDCGATLISTRKSDATWIESNWLMICLSAGAGLLMTIIIIIIIIIVIQRRRRRPRRGTTESHACVIPPNDYEEFVRFKTGMDMVDADPIYHSID